MTKTHQLDSEKRFAFGKNWQNYVTVVTEAHIKEAKKSLSDMLGMTDLRGLTFLDIGCGSGLFSLAARRLGAVVRSFDYDDDSVKATELLKDMHCKDDPEWTISRGSILDSELMNQTGEYDIIYSWGVLHHTGHLWQAVHNASLPVKSGGYLYIAIYNDQGLISSCWSLVKRFYCSGPAGRLFMQALFFPAFFVAGFIWDIVRLKSPLTRYREHIHNRGMSLIHDWKDWLGGYPYEVATPERVVSYVENRGFTMHAFKKPVIGFGNNQFVFRRNDQIAPNAKSTAY